MITNITIYKSGVDDYGMQVMQQDGRQVTVSSWPTEKRKLLNELLEYAESIKTPEEIENDKLWEILKQTVTDEQLKVIRKSMSDNHDLHEEIIDWYKPSSKHNYSKGELVRYTDGKVYESKLKVNKWSPDDFAAAWILREDLE